MARNDLYGDQRLLPFLVRLTKPYDDDPKLRAARPILMYLDLRGGEFTRPTQNQLAEAFDWMTKAFRLGINDLSDYALMITPIRADQDEHVVGSLPAYIPDDWPTVLERSFLWLPVAETDKRYAWQN